MKILIVNSLYPPDIIGGAEISTNKLAEALARRGHKIEVLTTGAVDTDELYNGVLVHRRRFRNIESFWKFKHSTLLKRITYKIIDYYNILNRTTLEKEISSISPDIIQINNLYGMSPIIWDVSQKLEIPIVQTLRDYYLMCPKANLMNRRGENCRKPRLVCRAFRHFYRNKSHLVDAVNAPSKYTLEQFLRCNYFTRADKQVIYNAIDLDIDEVVKNVKRHIDQRINRSEVNFVYVGGFLETKGINVLLQAIKLAPSNYHFHFAGRGKLQDKIEEMEQHSSNVHIHGFLNENELNNLLKEMDCLVCPSVWPEPFGRVIIDSYKAGLPVIATRCGGLPELIDDGITGIIVNPNSSEELQKAFSQINKEKILSPQFEEAVIKRLLDFSVENQATKFETVFQTLKKNNNIF